MKMKIYYAVVYSFRLIPQTIMYVIEKSKIPYKLLLPSKLNLLESYRGSLGSSLQIGSLMH